jgi:hypothetical protein
MKKLKQKHQGKKNICTTSIGVRQTGQGDWSGRRLVQPSQKGWPQLRTRFMGFNKQTLHKSATAFASGSPPSRGGRTALPPVHLDLFVVAVQLVGEEHQHPVHLDLFGVAVQLGGEEHLLPVHLDFFVVTVQLGDEEHQHPGPFDLFGVAVQLVGEEHLPPVHLDLFGVAVQLGDEEHQHPVHLDLFGVAVQLSPVSACLEFLNED